MSDNNVKKDNKFMLIWKNAIFRAAFVLTCVALGCGLLVGGIYLITNPIIEAAEKERTIDNLKGMFTEMTDYKEVESDKLPDGVKSPYYSILNGEVILGYVFTGNGSNQHGDIVINVGVDVKENIKSIIFSTNGQSPGYKDKVEENALDMIGRTLTVASDEAYKPLVTGATNGFNLLKKIIGNIKDAFHGEELGAKDPYELIFGDNYIKEDVTGTIIQEGEVGKSNSFQVTSKVSNKDGSKKGIVYLLTAYGIYVNMPEYDMVESGKVMIELIVSDDEDSVLLGFLIDTKDKSKYGHTESYSSTMIQNLEKTVGKKLSEFPSPTLSAGGTNTMTTVYGAIQFLLERKGEVE